MSTTLKDKFTPVLKNIINEREKKSSGNIYVFTGITPYVDIDVFASNITDKDTFDKEGNDELFNKNWFGRIFPQLMSTQSFHILSHQQYAYIISYIPNFFQDRAIIIYDNLRSLFPIKKEDYLEIDDGNSDEERPDKLPIYQAEQSKIDNKYYYILKQFDDNFEKQKFFTQTRKLETGKPSLTCEVLDVISNPYSIDAFVNQSIEENTFNEQIYVRVSSKNVLNKTSLKTLQELNALLGVFGGGVYELQEEAIQKDFTPRDETLALLRKYWGEQANFNDILIYENPDISKETIPVSQGKIVETIIDEYKKGCQGKLPRDIFITAPTGAGKSLLFQLPAFYAAKNGDVTIVVSPLKALMTDQVEILHNQRHYDRVEFLNSDLTLIDRDNIINECKRGNIDILYLSPELLLSYDIRHFLGERKLGLLIIDEAHLITTWGRDFRVDYWFLGNHINKIRKYNKWMFPLVALTATAVYGGTNDMVFDSINSLNMHDAHKFIGNVRRNDIEFVFDTHDDYPSNYERNKEAETIKLIKGIHDLDMKGIVYAPLTTHVQRLKLLADQEDPTMSVAYYGKQDRDSKRDSYKAFRGNICKVMIATKAFGMGVDIKDIQVVYHYAPSGLLPDYIQEIGRVARDKEIQGYAALTFSNSDLRYSKQLFGISSQQTYQLQEILRKIIRIFKNNGEKRNMLVSTEDFAYVFSKDKSKDKSKDELNDGIENKVAAALMMIEKDYLAKSHYNVFIARPKKLFTKVYARTNDIGIERLHKSYGECFTEIRRYGNNHTIELDLNDIWLKHFSNKSFPKLKKDFYEQCFLSEQDIELVPQIKFNITLSNSSQSVLRELMSLKDSLSKIFSNFKSKGHFFTQNDFVDELSHNLNKEYNVEKIAEFILNTYSAYKKMDSDAFLQLVHRGNVKEYQVFDTSYEGKFLRLLRIFMNLYNNVDSQTTIQYLSVDETQQLSNHIKLGSLIDIMALGTFETAGGSDPKIFLRLNDPDRIENDSKDKNYCNTILDAVKKRHRVSCELFEHFFTNYFANERRWDLIEDFFLGMSNDELFERYQGAGINHIDIIDYLKKNTQNIDTSTDNGEQTNSEFKPKANTFYRRDRLITIGQKTMSVKKWVTEDPVSLHRTISYYNIGIVADDYKALMSKLENNHFAYYRDYMGLKLFIEFPGYPKKVKASIPYTDCPVKFYKWWKANPEKIRLEYKDQLMLFAKVEEENPKALLKKHRNMINKK